MHFSTHHWCAFLFLAFHYACSLHFNSHVERENKLLNTLHQSPWHYHNSPHTHGHLKLSPALFSFLSPEHLQRHQLSQHWHHIEFAPTPLLQTQHGYLPLCGLTAGCLPITINLVLFMFNFNPLVSISLFYTPKKMLAEICPTVL